MSGEAKDFFIFGLAIDREIALLVLGAIIGFGASLGTNWINNRTQRKKEETEKALNIIAEVVRFIVKTHHKAGDIVINMNDFHSRMSIKQTWYSGADAVSAEKEKIEYLAKLEDRSGDFYEECNFIRIQLKRLGDVDIYAKFDNLIQAYDKFYKAIFEAEISTVEKEHLELNELSNEFINLCVEISKIDAPIRTPSAPTKKKGSRAKS